MRKYWFSYALGILFLILVGNILPASALEPVVLSERETYPLGKHLETLEDPSGNWSILDVTTPPLKQTFQPNTQDAPNFSFTHSAHWLRFQLSNPSNEAKDWLLEIDFANIDRVDFFLPIAPNLYRLKTTGRQYPFPQREVKNRNFVFKLATPPQTHQTYYLRVYSTASMYLPVTLFTPAAFATKDHEFQLGFGFYYGIIFVMVFYNLVLYLAVRDKNYLYYVLTLVTLHGLFQLSLNGLGFEYLWPMSTWWNTHAMGFLMNLGVFFVLLFSQSFLKTQTYLPRVHTALIWARWLVLCLGIMNLTPDDSFWSHFSVFWATKADLMIALVIWLAGIVCWRKGYQPARYFLIAWSSLMLGGLLTGLRALGFLPSSFLTNYAMQIGSAFEVILLSLAMGDQMQMAQREKYEAQEAILQQERMTREAQTELVRFLQKMNKLKDDFLANISHELRTPLNGIIGIGESMLDGVAGNMTPPQKENLYLIVSSGKRLFSLVSDLLDFSQLKHRDITLNLRPLDIKSLVDVVLILCEPLIGDRDIQLINAIPVDTPPVEADEDRVQQILHNLVGNAIKFTQIGTIEISAQTGGQFLEITVADTGIGIPKDKQEIIFESFEQVDSATAREYGGTGLGLAITQKLVELHGGQIRLESEPGQGSRFHFLLPLATDTVDNRPPVKSLSTETPPVIPSRVTSLLDSRMVTGLLSEQNPLTADHQFHLLVVDDEAINLQVLVNVLSLQKYTVTKALSGQEALDLLKKNHYDLILLDIMMPKMSGYEVCKAIRQEYPPNEMPIVFLTAKSQMSSLVEGFDAGANDYLTKPIRKNELLSRIKIHIQLSQINTSYARFVPREFLQFLGHESIINVQLGDQVQQNMTVMFLDIREFTALSETLTPKQNFDFINEFLGRISPIIRGHDGFIDKYIGDGFMALFSGSVGNAIDAAIAILGEINTYNRERAEKDYTAIQVGIGLHTGSLMLGTIGEAERMEGTVISDAVNMASRMEGLTRRFGCDLIVSEETFNQVSNRDQYQHRFLGWAKVKGKQNSIAVFEIFNSDSPSQRQAKLKTAPAFETGVRLFHEQKHKQARIYFQEILAQTPNDRAAQFYLHFEQNSSQEDILTTQ